ncbi:unnamed protein product, partial [Strongylus vulgaris]
MYSNENLCSLLHYFILRHSAENSCRSFFVSDTACTALMIPIALAIIQTITDTTESVGHGKGKDGATIEGAAFEHLKGDERGFAKALVLACAHGSLIGGTAIITSTGPNLVFREIVQTSYAENEVSVSYVQWMMFAMPPMLLYLVASFIVLTCCFMGPRQLCLWFSRPSKEEQRVSLAVQKRIHTAYDELGIFTFGEKSILAWFLVLMACWIMRKPGFIPGWGELFPNHGFGEKSILAWFLVLMACWIMRKPGFIPGWGELFPNHGKLLSDTVPAVLVVFLLFAWPRDPFAKDPYRYVFTEPIPILNWNAMKAKFSWSCILLIGAGYAISEGVEVSLYVQQELCMVHCRNLFYHVHDGVCEQCVHRKCFYSHRADHCKFLKTQKAKKVAFFLEAESLHIHPLYLSLPVTVACSFAFMLPMATPPNAIVYDTKLVGMLEMIMTGVLLNICCIFI